MTLNEEARAELENWAHNSTTERHLAFLARMLLRLATGGGVEGCAREAGTTPLTVSKWRDRFPPRGAEGVWGAPRPGKAKIYDDATGARILECLDTPRPAGDARWGGTLSAKPLGDVSPHQVRRDLLNHRNLAGASSELVHWHRSRVCRQDGRYRRVVPQAAGTRRRTVRGRNAVDSGSRTHAGLAAIAQ